MPSSDSQPQPRRPNLTKVAWTLFALAILAGLAVIGIWRYQVANDPYYYYRKGAEAWQAGNVQAAYPLLREAAQRQPNNADYWRAAAGAAEAVGQRTEAAQFARRAWDLGLRNSDHIRLMVAASSLGDPEAELTQGLALLDELPRDRTNLLVRVDLLLAAQKPAEAIQVLREMIAEEGDPDVRVRLATAYLGQGDAVEAQRLLEEWRQKQELNADGYRLLAVLSLLDRRGYTNAPVILTEAQQRGLYSSETRIDHAIAYLVNARAAEAIAVLEPISGTAENPSQNDLHATARLYLAELYLRNENPDDIQKLLTSASASPRGPIREGEELAYRGALKLARGESDALADLRGARKLIPGHPALELMFAREALRTGAVDDAVSSIGEIRGAIAFWPLLAYERALVLSRAGRDQEALNALDTLHQRGISSKESLQLFRDLAFRNNLAQVGQATQRHLEQRFAGDTEIQAYAAYAALQRQDFDAARAIMAELSEQHPQDVRFQLGQVEVLLAEGRNQEAFDALSRIDGAPGTVAALKGTALLRLEQWEPAAVALAQAVELAPTAAIHAQYARLLLRLDRADEARAQFELAVEKAPRDPEANLGLALLDYSDRRFDSARSRAQTVLSASGGGTARQLIMLGAAESQLGSTSNALHYTQLALARDPSSVEARLLRGRLHLTGGQFGEAESDLRFVLASRPNDPEVLQWLALSQVRSGQFTDALGSLDRLLADQSANLPARQLRFEAYALRGDLEQAARDLEQLHPQLTAPQLALNTALLSQLRKDTNAAIATLQAQLADPGVAFRWMTLQLGQGAEESVLKEADRHSFGVGQWAVLGSLAEQGGLLHAARRFYEKALELDPANPMILNNLAWIEIQTPGFNADRAIERCRVALEGMPRSPVILHTYGQTLVRSGRFRECLALLSAEQLVVGQNARLLHVLGQAYEGAGEPQAALAAYRSCQGLAARDVEQGSGIDLVDLEQRIQKLASAR